LKISWFKKKKEKKATQQQGSPSSVVKRRISFMEVFVALSLGLFEKPSKGLTRAFEFDKVLLRAGLSVHPVKYAAETLTLTVLTAIFSIAGFIGLILTGALTPIGVVIGLLVVIVLNVAVFASRLVYPYLRASSRRVETENELPYFMAYLSTMARSGVSLERVLERVAMLRVFKAIKLEAQRVLTRIKAYGEDPITAVENIALNHPSSKFRDVILGYTTTLRSGGDIVHYLEVRTRELFESRANEIKAILGRLTSFLEVYAIFGVIVALALYVFFSVSAAISAAQALRTPEEIAAISIDISTPALYNFFILPLIGLAIGFSIHINQPRTPIGYYEVYLTLLSWLPVSLVVFTVILIVTYSVEVFYGKFTLREVIGLVYATLGALIAASIPPTLKYWSIVKRRRGLVKATADLLRDISEIRRTGLSPEKCIVLVSSRDYRNLTPVVERAAAALSLGLNLEDALRRALRGIKEWFVCASFRFLADSIIVGGGSPEIIDTLARFTQTLSELEEETRRRMRSQIILPYLGAILLSSMPMILLYMLLALAKIPVAIATPLVFVLAMGAVVNSYIMGLIAGKASEATVAAGFLHAILLETVTALSLLITFRLIGVF